MDHKAARHEQQSTVEDEDILLRRVPKKPSCLETDNAGGYILRMDAFKYDYGPKYKDHPGVSVSLQSVWEGVEPSVQQRTQVEPDRWTRLLYAALDWNEFGIASFTAAMVRKPIPMTLESGDTQNIPHGEVYRDPVDEDEGHALIRVNTNDEDRALRRKYWLPLRSRLREAAVFHDSPSQVPSLTSW